LKGELKNLRDKNECLLTSIKENEANFLDFKQKSDSKMAVLKVTLFFKLFDHIQIKFYSDLQKKQYEMEIDEVQSKLFNLALRNTQIQSEANTEIESLNVSAQIDS
jgi:hypothetical protein